MLGQAKYVRISKKRHSRFWVFAFSAMLALLLTGLGWAFRIDQRLASPARSASRVRRLIALWEERSYDRLIGRCQSYLQQDPLNGTYLALEGFALFYKAQELAAADQRMPYLEQATVSLRRALLAGEQSWPERVRYVLGKTYYHRGRYYYDLAVRYLEQALQNGYKGEDSYDYLGAALVGMGEEEKGLTYFLKAIDEHPSDALYLTVAMVYYRLKDWPKATDYFIRARNATGDREVEEKSRFMLAGIYLQEKQFYKAEQEYRAILKKDPRSADAYFGLGEVYRMSGEDQGKARAMYREALRLDPSHVGAKLEYYGR